MSLHFMEGFGSYDDGAHTQGSGDDLNLQWENYGSVTITALTADSNGTRKYLTGEAGDNARPEVAGLSSSTIVLGFRFYHTGQGIENLICRYLNSVGSDVGSLGMLDSRLIYVISTNSNLQNNRVLLSTIELRRNQWHYIEVVIVFNNSTGSVSFFIDDIAAGSVSSVDTQASGSDGPIEELEFMSNTSGHDWRSNNRIADLYIDDATRHGPMEIYYQEVDTAGTEADWTPSAGNNEDNVDEIGPDGDSTYNSTTVLTDTDSMLTSKALDEDPLALQAMAHVRYVPGTGSTVRVGIKSDPGGSPTESFGSALALTADYHGVRGAIEEVDPDTSSAWTAANADAAETVYEQVT